MNKEILILTGLHPVIELPWLKGLAENELTKELGINTTVVDLEWEKRKNFFELENNIDEKIKRIDGKVVLIGIGEGMTAALLTRHKYGENKISEIVSVCGWSWPEIGLRNFELEKLNGLRESNPVFGQMIKKYTKLFLGEISKANEVADRFVESDWKRILAFVAENDQFVPRNCSVIGPVMEVIEMEGQNHVEGIVSALTTRKKEIRKFILRKQE